MKKAEIKKTFLFFLLTFMVIVTGIFIQSAMSVHAQSSNDPNNSGKKNSTRVSDEKKELTKLLLKRKEKNLHDIEKKLREKEALLNEREARLEEIKKDINLTLDKKIEELTQLKTTIEKALLERQRLKEQQMAELAKLYEGATPEQASSILEKLDPKIAAQIFLSMNKRNAGKIWGFVNPDIAVKITKHITKEQNFNVPFHNE
ncbi:MAG: MotE family protein [bacterium]